MLVRRAGLLLFFFFLREGRQTKDGREYVKKEKRCPQFVAPIKIERNTEGERGVKVERMIACIFREVLCCSAVFNFTCHSVRLYLCFFLNSYIISILTNSPLVLVFLPSYILAE